jgi:hypothetical protein
MAYDINLQRVMKAARIAAGVQKYSDLSPTEPTPEDDARVLRECNAVFFGGAAPVLPPVETDVPEPIAPPKAAPAVEAVDEPAVEAVDEPAAEPVVEAPNAV